MKHVIIVIGLVKKQVPGEFIKAELYWKSDLWVRDFGLGIDISVPTDIKMVHGYWFISIPVSEPWIFPQ